MLIRKCYIFYLYRLNIGYLIILKKKIAKKKKHNLCELPLEEGDNEASDCKTLLKLVKSKCACN